MCLLANYSKRYKGCFIVIASDQRERGNLAAFGIASVTSFLRNDTLFNAFVLAITSRLNRGGFNGECTRRPPISLNRILLDKYLLFLGSDKDFCILFQPEVSVTLLSDLYLNGVAPFADQLHLHQGSCRVDVLHPGAEMIRISRLVVDLQQVRADVDHGGFSIQPHLLRELHRHIADMDLTPFDSPFEEIHVAEEIVDERVGRVVIDLIRRPNLL